MLFRALIVSLGYLWLDLRILFASNSLKLCFKLFFFTGVSNYCEERKKKKNRKQKLFGIPESKFSAFYEHNRNSLILPAVVSPGRTLCYEGRETTASNRLLFHRACASTWHHFLLFCKKHQQNNNFTRTSQFLVHFFPFLRDYDVKKMPNFAFLYGERKSSKAKLYSLSSLDMVLRNSTPSYFRLHLTKLVSRNNLDNDWKRANSQRARVKAAVVSSSKCARAFNNLLFKTGFYPFKVNLFVHGAGRRLGLRSKQLLAVVFLPS